MSSFHSDIQMSRFLLLAFVLATIAVEPVHAQSEPISLETVQTAYTNLDALQAEFTQVVSSEFAEDSTRLAGTVLLSGNRYRVQTPEQTVVTDGTTTWIYTPADTQVVVNDANQGESAVTPDAFLTASGERYTVTETRDVQRSGRPHHRLEVKATDSASQFETATLWVRESDHIVSRMRATDRNGSSLDLRLHEIEVNPTIVDTAFTFQPPDRVEVIDLRQNP